MTHRYRNPWYQPGLLHYGPEFYTTDAKPTEYRGFFIFQRVPGAWDLVKDGVCLTQRVGRNGPRLAVDAFHGEAEDSWVPRMRAIARRFGVTLPLPPAPL